MGLAQTVKHGRRAAERLMTSMVEVRRFTGETVIDEDTLIETPVYDVVYSGIAKIASYEAFEQTPEAAGGVVTVVRLRADFPVGSFVAKPGDACRVLSDLSDPLLAGRVYRLTVSAPYKSHATAYRVAAEEVTDDA